MNDALFQVVFSGGAIFFLSKGVYIQLCCFEVRNIRKISLLIQIHFYSLIAEGGWGLERRLDFESRGLCQHQYSTCVALSTFLNLPKPRRWN